MLQGIEERGAEARGVPLLTARRKSHRAAEAMVTLARQYRRSPDQSVGLPLATALLRASERPEEFLAAIETIEGPDGPPFWREAWDRRFGSSSGLGPDSLPGAFCWRGSWSGCIRMH